MVLPPEYVPNFAVLVHIVFYPIQSTPREAPDMMYSEDLIMWLGLLSDQTARKSLLSFFSKWIDYFNSPIFTVVDRGSNLTALYMAEKL